MLASLNSNNLTSASVTTRLTLVVRLLVIILGEVTSYISIYSIRALQRSPGQEMHMIKNNIHPLICTYFFLGIDHSASMSAVIWYIT